MLGARRKKECGYQGPESLPIVGCIPKVKEEGVLNFLMNNAVSYGDIIPFRMGIDSVLQINHPSLIEEILRIKHKRFKKASNHQRFREVLGDGLLTSNGEKWKKDRQRLQPVFKRDLIEGIYFQKVQKVGEALTEEWGQKASAGAAVNVTEDMARATLKIMLHTIFGERVSEADVLQIDSAIREFMDYVGLPRLLPNVDVNKLVGTSKYRDLKKTRGELKKLVKRLYFDELGAPSDEPNMMKLMIFALQNDEDSFCFEDLYDHSITMFFAGYETTATLLQWAWHCLEQNPCVETKLLEELSSLDSLSQFSFQAIDGFPYLDAFLKETMRLYPSFWATTRASIEIENLGGMEIRPSQTLLLPQYVMHRHPRFWDNPEEFKPERFLSERQMHIVPGSYFPFSIGHRKCVGYRFAEMEAKVLISMLLPIFRLREGGERSYELKPIISLRLEEDLIMRLQYRK